MAKPSVVPVCVPKKMTTLCLPSSGSGSSLGFAARGRGGSAWAAALRCGGAAAERRASSATPQPTSTAARGRGGRRGTNSPRMREGVRFGRERGRTAARREVASAEEREEREDGGAFADALVRLI